jgi:hypothetical protein
MQPWKRAKMPLRHQKTPMWSHGHVFLIFLEFFDILVPISYLHLKKIQKKNIGKKWKDQKANATLEKGTKMSNALENPNVITWPFIFSNAF